MKKTPMSLAFTLWLISHDCQPSCYTKHCGTVTLISDSHSIITLSELPHKTLQPRHPAFITPSPPRGHMERLCQIDKWPGVWLKPDNTPPEPYLWVIVQRPQQHTKLTFALWMVHCPFRRYPVWSLPPCHV